MQVLALVVFTSLSFFSFPIVAKTKKGNKLAVAVEVNLVTVDSEISFDKKTLSVPFGKEIQLTYRNQAPVDSEISHKLAVINLGMEEELTAILKKQEYDGEKLEKKYFLAISQILNPGEKQTLNFRPPKPGVYTYICLMPGHAAIFGMTGQLTIR